MKKETETSGRDAFKEENRGVQETSDSIDSKSSPEKNGKTSVASAKMQETDFPQKSGKEKNSDTERRKKPESEENDRTPENAYARQIKRRRRQRRVRTFITLLVLALLGAGGYQLYLYLQKMNTKTEESASTVSYRVQRVTEGSITSTISYSGAMKPKATESEYAVYTDSKVASINVSLGATFHEGDILMTLELDEENELVTSMETLNDELSTTNRLADSRYLRANAKGYIKDIKLYAGCDVTEIMAQYGYIALTCLDNRMQTFVKTNELEQYEKVKLVIDGKEYEGVVQGVKDGKANIIIETSKPEVDADAEIFKKDGTSVGIGKMELVSYSLITAVDGYITDVPVKDGQLVRKNDKIALCRDLPTTTAYQELIDQKEDLQAEIDEATVIYAPFDGRVLEINAAEGDVVNTETALLTVQSLEGYTISLAVDELDIAAVKMGQKATVKLDALEGSFDGEVSYISYVNSSSGNTVRYTVEVSVDDVPGALPDMSATCTIITADSGLGLIIPAEAVQNIEGKNVVYKAPKGAQFGLSFKETELDFSTLEKHEIEVLQADGSSLLVKGDLKKDDLILISNRTTSARYTSSSSTQNRNGFGFGSGMPGNFGGGMTWNNNRSGGSGSNGRSGSNRGN